MKDNDQVAPYPEVLARLVSELRYRPGWRFTLRNIDRGQGSVGLTLDVLTFGYNSYHPPQQPPWSFGPGEVCAACGEAFPCPSYATDKNKPDSTRQPYCVHHYFPVPPAAYDERSWMHWLFEQILLVERHEAMEFFRFEWDEGEGATLVSTTHHPYAPNHGPGHDPYIVAELSTDEERRTNFKGTVKW